MSACCVIEEAVSWSSRPNSTPDGLRKPIWFLRGESEADPGGSASSRSSLTTCYRPPDSMVEKRHALVRREDQGRFRALDLLSGVREGNAFACHSIRTLSARRSAVRDRDCSGRCRHRRTVPLMRNALGGAGWNRKAGRCAHGCRGGARKSAGDWAGGTGLMGGEKFTGGPLPSIRERQGRQPCAPAFCPKDHPFFSANSFMNSASFSAPSTGMEL
jgi:hypothetical protein